jgi:phosphoglycerate kinase
MNKKTIRDIDLNGKKVLIRVDFNVPFEDGKVSDDRRIAEAVPTIKAILAQKPRSVAMMTHFGRPKDGPDPKYSLKQIVAAVSDKLEMPVAFVEECAGSIAEKAVEALPAGGVILLENTRFQPGETKNDMELAKQMARLGDVYVNDAFGSAHRAHSSTEGVAHFLPAVAGLLMEKEIKFLGNALENPKRPFIAILGGAKISDKIGVIENLLDKADKVLVGGGMANTFFKAQGITVGKSLVEDEALATAKTILSKSGTKLLLPIDGVLADAFDKNANTRVSAIKDGIPDDWQILDIGPETIKVFDQALADAMTIVWNGPMGVFEMEKFAVGTFAVAKTAATRAKAGAVTIIGGGDSAAAVQEAGLAEQVTHVSTGGGASLEMLEGKILPGLAALNDK